MIKHLSLALCLVACLFAVDAAAARPSHAHALARPAVKVEPLAQAASAVAPSLAEFPVRFADVEIFSVSTSPVGSMTPEQRAALITQNIQAFADGTAASASLGVVAQPMGAGIGNDAGLLMLVTERDAEKTGKTPMVLAQEVLGRIRVAVDDYRARHSWKTYGLGVVLTLLSVLGLRFALHWINRGAAWLTARVTRLESAWKRDVHFKNIRVLSSSQIERGILLGLRFLRQFVVLLSWYLFLLLVLSFFPETREFGSKIFDYLIAPFAKIFHALLGFIPNLFFIFVIGVVAFYSLKIIAYVFGLIERGELRFDWFYDEWARPTYQIVRFLVIVTALVSAYPYIPGSSSQAFQGVGLVLGAIISFASSSAISNIVAGIILTYTRAFRLNDRIKVGDSTGDVVEKTLLVTRIRTIKHVIVTIPNSLVMGAQIVNYSTSVADGEGVILHTSVTIGYDVPWQTVQSLLVEAALATPDILRHPAPFVLQTSLDDYYVSHEINAYTRAPERMATIYSDLHRNILDKFDAAGVEIMSPHYYALRDGNASTVPSVAADGGYVPPSFRVGKG